MFILTSLRPINIDEIDILSIGDNMKNLIMIKFEVLRDKIKCEHSLEEYVNFCLLNNVPTLNTSISALHHILPQAKLLPFLEYKSLVKHPWNGTRLTNYNHYYASFFIS